MSRNSSAESGPEVAAVDSWVDADLVDFVVDFPAVLIENSIISVSDEPATKIHVGPIRKVEFSTNALTPHGDETLVLPPVDDSTRFISANKPVSDRAVKLNGT